LSNRSASGKTSTRGLSPRKRHSDQVESDGDVRSFVTWGRPARAFELPALVAVDGVDGGAVVAAGAGFDLDHQDLSVPGDDVNLAVRQRQRRSG
jgi:hypothetical protein